MEAIAQLKKPQPAATTYRRIIVILGVAAMLFSIYWLPTPRFDLRFLLLSVVMMLVCSRFAIQLPRANTAITVSDTFIFLVLLLMAASPAFWLLPPKVSFQACASVRHRWWSPLTRR